MSYYKVEKVFGVAGVDYEVGQVVELDETSTETQELLTTGFLVPQEMEEHVVTEGDVKFNADLGIDISAQLGETVIRPKVEAPATETSATEVETAEETAEETAAEVETAEETAAEVEETIASPKLTYRGQDVLAHSIRTVNDQDYNHLRLADGSECDISDDEYATMLKDAGVVI